MNCDTAFDLMTDTNGSGSPSLALHLSNCPRCRQMRETLAPALGFLAPAADERWPHVGASGFDDSTAGAAAPLRKPFVTVESVRIARQAAGELAASADRSFGRGRLVRSLLNYGAAFAAGMMLAASLLHERQPAAPPSGTCTRGAASGDDWQGTSAEIRLLALSCAGCHAADRRAGDDRSTWLVPAPGNVFERGALLFHDEVGRPGSDGERFRTFAVDSPAERKGGLLQLCALPIDQPEQGIDRVVPTA